MATGMSFLPLKTVKDFRNLILKTYDFLNLIDTSICRMREGISKKIVFSKTVMGKVIEQCEDVVKSKSYLVKKVPQSVKDEYDNVLDVKLTKKLRN